MDLPLRARDPQTQGLKVNLNLNPVNEKVFQAKGTRFTNRMSF